MAEPFSLSVLGATALTEGIKFLYGQAVELLRIRRERHAIRSSGAAVAETENVPLPASPVLDATPTQSAVNGAVLDQEGSVLVELAGTLSPYAQDLADVDAADATLIEQIERARSLLEALYGQRLTFRGEQREPTGSTIVDVKQVLGLVREAVGVDIDEVAGGSAVTVDQDVAEAGRVVGARITKLGG